MIPKSYNNDHKLLFFWVRHDNNTNFLHNCYRRNVMLVIFSITFIIVATTSIVPEPVSADSTIFNTNHHQQKSHKSSSSSSSGIIGMEYDTSHISHGSTATAYSGNINTISPTFHLLPLLFRCAELFIFWHTYCNLKHRAWAQTPKAVSWFKSQQQQA